MGFLFCVNPTQHIYCSHHAQLIILSFPPNTSESKSVGGRESGMEMGKVETEKKQKEKRVGEALNQETEITAQDKKNRTQRPPGFGVSV